MSNYPTVRPSLTLDFQKCKQLDPRIAFSRASSATYVEAGVIKTADEHQARFEDEGLLIEEIRANIYKYSNLMNPNNGSTPSNFTANAGTAPDGTNTAFKLVQKPSSDGVALQGQNFSIGAKDGPLAVFSVFAKAGEDRYLYITPYLSVSLIPPVFDLQTGTISNPDNHAAVMRPLANGWYRCSLRVRRGGFASMRWGISNVADAPQSNNGVQFEGDGTSGLLVWGAQYEMQTINAQNQDAPIDIEVSSVIPTAGSTVTRAADVLQITGDNFNSWFNQNKGSLAVDINVPKRDQGRQILSILETQTTSINSFRGIGITQGSIGGSDYVNRMVWWFGGSRHTSGPVVPYEGKFAQSFEAVGTGGLAVNGSITYNATNLNKSVTLTGLFANSTFTCKRISFYPERLTNEQLEAITS